MASSFAQRPLVSWLYNHNPFYVISAALMLYGVRTAYGEMNIGEINCWILLGVLSGYTAILAGLSVLIVRSGQVWEDARSLLMLLLLLFLAVSVGADDLFVSFESSANGSLLMVGGYLFAATVTELVLRGMRLRLGWKYRLPLHLLLVLFYIAPWWCSPGSHTRSVGELEWSIFAFPIVAAVLLLGLLPAVRSGPEYVNHNGSPWRWPWFPWPAFVMTGVAVAFRSFALAMAFGPSGPIWNEFPSGVRQISFDIAWGPYFLIPLVLAALILVLEAGFVTGNQKTVGFAMKAAPWTLLLAVPFSNGPVFRGFLGQVVDNVGSPLWLTVWLLSCFYLVAWLRGAAGAQQRFLILFSLLSIVGPKSIHFPSLMSPQAWPLVVVACVLTIQGIRNRSSQFCLGGAAVFTLALWLALPTTTLGLWRTGISFHFFWGVIILLGFLFRDSAAAALRFLGAFLVPMVAVIAMHHQGAAEIPIWWRIAYLAVLTTGCLAIAAISRNKWYWYAFLIVMTLHAYEAAAVLFRDLVALVGQRTIAAIVWSAASLLIAFLISAHKAHWLPQRYFPRWNSPTASPPSETSDISEAPSSTGDIPPLPPAQEGN